MTDQQANLSATDPRELRCRKCDNAGTLRSSGTLRVVVGDGTPAYEVEQAYDDNYWCVNDATNCGEGAWGEMGYIWYPGITQQDMDEQKEPWA